MIKTKDIQTSQPLNFLPSTSAFTLAEVMIVLAIIGILVAILLPSAQNLTPDEALMRFQKNNVNLANAIRNLVNSEEYYYNGDFGLDRNNEDIVEPKYFCSTLADMLGAKRINCSEDNLGYNSSALVNLPDMLTYEMEDGSMIYDYTDCICKNHTTSGEEIILNNGTIIYTINPYWHFGSKVDESDKRLFNPCSKEKRYKIICMDIDGLNNGEDPFSYAIRTDGRIIYGSRAQAWVDRKINDKDETLIISSIDSCELTALNITPEEDSCTPPANIVYPSGGTSGDSTPSVQPVATELLFAFDGSYSELESTTGGQKIMLKSNGTFTALNTIKGTMYLVGGGGGGANGNPGGGGGGGYINETLFTFIANTNYNVVIGAGGSPTTTGGATYFNTLSAEGGEGATGGTGATGGANGGNHNSKGADGTQIDGQYYGGGGGGAGWYNNVAYTSGAEGGLGGGAHGGPYGGSGSNAENNTGGGGGGAGQNAASFGCIGGSGGSGIVIILIDPPEEE